MSYEAITLVFQAAGWVFTLGLTFGYLKTSLNGLDQRLSRVEAWIDKQ